jgi:hypothetical protein
MYIVYFISIELLFGIVKNGLEFIVGLADIIVQLEKKIKGGVKMFYKKCRCGKTGRNFMKDIGEFYIEDCCTEAGYDYKGNLITPPSSDTESKVEGTAGSSGTPEQTQGAEGSTALKGVKIQLKPINTKKRGRPPKVKK